MIALAWILLFAADSNVELVDDVRQIPPHQWHYVEDLGLKQRSGRVFARFDAGKEGPQVKLSLFGRDEFDHFRRGQPAETIAESPAAPAGVLNVPVQPPGDYVVVVNNLSDEPARVHLRIFVQHPRVTTLSPERRRTVILLSFAFFIGVVSFSARKLLRGIRT